MSEPPDRRFGLDQDHPKPTTLSAQTTRDQTDVGFRVVKPPKPMRLQSQTTRDQPEKIRSKALQQRRTISRMFFITVLLKDHTIYGLSKSGKFGIKLKSRD